MTRCCPTPCPPPRTLLAWRIAAGAYMAALAIIVLLADLGRLPLGAVRGIPYYDTGLHFLLFGLAGLLVHRALDRRWVRLGPVPLPLGPSVLVVVISIEELAQRLLPTRTWELSDLIAGVLGVILFVALGAAVDTWRTARARTAEGPRRG